MTKKQNVENTQNTLSESDIMRRRIVFSISLLGIFSILTGLGLIIAANWAVIPAILKVSGGLACLAMSLVATSIFQKNKKTLWTEAFLFISFLLIGGNIALIQQSYHLSLSWQMGSLTWWALSLPLVFFARYKLIPLCSIGLLLFSIWDIIWEMNYMLLVGILFVLMMATFFFNGSKAKIIRDLAFILAIFFLYVGDISSGTALAVTGVITTTLFLIFALDFTKTEEGQVRYYNCLFVFVAWRIFLLFWNAYYDLNNIGIMLVVFGTVLLVGAGLYTYYLKQIKEFIRGLIKYEQN